MDKQERLSDLPVDVLPLIFKHVSVYDLAATAQVCRTWNYALTVNGAEVWISLYEKYRPPYQLPLVSNFKRHAQNLREKLKISNDYEEIERMQKRLTSMYKILYRRFRLHVCQQCLCVTPRLIEPHVLFSKKLRLCNACQKDERYAAIYRTEAEALFGLGLEFWYKQALLLPYMKIGVNNRRSFAEGTKYRFLDIVKAAVQKFGEVEAERKAKNAKAFLGIINIHDMDLKPV